MKSTSILIALIGFTQGAFAWVLPPPIEGGNPTPPPIKILQDAAYWPPAPGTGGRPTPPPKGIQNIAYWPPAPGTGGHPTPPPKILQISDQEEAPGIIRVYRASVKATREQAAMELIQDCLSNPLAEQHAITFSGIENLKFQQMPDGSYAGGDCVFKNEPPEAL